jgi:hypothetical protein
MSGERDEGVIGEGTGVNRNMAKIRGDLHTWEGNLCWLGCIFVVADPTLTTAVQTHAQDTDGRGVVSILHSASADKQGVTEPTGNIQHLVVSQSVDDSGETRDTIFTVDVSTASHLALLSQSETQLPVTVRAKCE